MGNANDTKYLGTERVWNKRKCAQHPCGCGPKWHGIFDAWWVQVCRLHTQGCGLVVLRPNLTHGTKGSFRLDALGSRQGFRVFFVAWGASFLIVVYLNYFYFNIICADTSIYLFGYNCFLWMCRHYIYCHELQFWLHIVIFLVFSFFSIIIIILLSWLHNFSWGQIQVTFGLILLSSISDKTTFQVFIYFLSSFIDLNPRWSCFFYYGSIISFFPYSIILCITRNFFFLCTLFIVRR